MKTYKKFLKISSILTLFLYHTIYPKFSFENLYAKVFSKPTSQRVSKELVLGKNKILSIENIYGNIHIKTEWKQKTIILQATKQISKKENPDDIDIKVDIQEKNRRIFIQTNYNTNKTKSPVHYELIVPNNIDITLKTQQGNIKVKHLKGNVTAETQKGDIKISQVTGAIATLTQNGNIKVSQSSGNILAKTTYGNIIIDDSEKSINAETQSGYIKTSCKKIPSTGSIHLTTNTGHIALEMPKSRDNINADIKAVTAKGRVTSEHFITLKTQTTTLDKLAWARFKREVNGTIGSGDSLIQVTSNFGNIKILKAKA